MSSEHNYALILAGGAGTRLWPKSRSARPKQFQAFHGEKSLLQLMISYVTQTVPMERVFIMATESFAETIRTQLPDLPEANLLYEPGRRDTGPAITLGVMQILARDPEATIATLWSDHVIRKAERFGPMLEAAFIAAQNHPDAIVSVGAKPTHPETGFGYIQMGAQLERHGSYPVFNVKRFVEKPDFETATEFVSSWEYLWNVGYNVFKGEAFMAELTRIHPELAEALTILSSTSDHEVIAKHYETIPKLSIDYLLMQQVSKQLVIPADVGWSDLGAWNAVYEVLQEATGKTFIDQGEVYNIESDDCLVYAKDRPIAMVGVKDLVVIDDGDAILIMDKKRSQLLKNLVNHLAEHKPTLL